MYNAIYIFPNVYAALVGKLKDKFPDKHKNIFSKIKISLIQLKQSFRSRR